MKHTAVLAAVASVAATIALGTATTQGATSAGGPAQAQADAAALLAQLQVPPGSQPTPGEPDGGGPYLAQPEHPATPNLAEVTAWWIVPGPPDQVLAWIAEHRPAGTTTTGVAELRQGGNVVMQSETFTWANTSGLADRTVVVEASARPDGSTALRADGQSVWLVFRPASEHLPAGLHVLRISVSGQASSYRLASLLVRNRSKVRRIANLVNALPAAQPSVIACPADLGPTVTLSFRRSVRGPLLALIRADSFGCGNVSFDLKGVHQPPLTGGRTLVSTLFTLLGFNPRSPPGRALPAP